MTIRRAEESDLEGVDKLLYQVEDIHRIGRPDLFRLGAKKYTDKQLLELFKDESKPVFVAVESHQESTATTPTPTPTPTPSPTPSASASASSCLRSAEADGGGDAPGKSCTADSGADEANNERVLGYVFCQIQVIEGEPSLLDRKTLYIDDLCVDESVRGRSVGRTLYDYVLGFARSNDCYNVTLHAWECNPKALAFYRHLGMKTMYTAFESIL